MGGTRFMVQWEEHPSHLATRLGQLLEHQTLVDVTLMCNTHTLRVHRAVLAACSPYFETILQRQLGMYPLIVLKDMQFSVLKSLIEFMYCGETSVTEDNLSALLQAAKFFQVKGLSAMTKEALGLTSPAPPKTTTTVNGEAARKAFVGRSKRVGMQQTFVASGLKTVTPSGSHVHGPGGDVHTPTAGKTIFQTTPKPVPVRQDTHQQQQQQTDTAQLLLSLSGSEFPKQTFHTVSKNVRFHYGASSGNVTVEPSRTCSLESSVVKNKEPPIKSEIIDRVPVVTPDGGVKSTSVMLPTQMAEKGLEQQIIPEKIVEGTKEDLTSQMFYVEDGPCKRGRPLKRQMNLVFQEKVLTDAEMALQKEAEASRKALEMLQQEMSTGDETPNTVAVQPAENVQQKVAPVKQPVTKIQPSQVNNLTTTSRILPKESTVTSKLSNQKTNVTQVTTVNAPETSSQNVIYQVAGNTIPAIDSNSNETNIVYQLQEGQDSGNTNIVYQVADNTVLTGQDSNNQNIIYQVADSAGTSTEGNNNTNIIYQVAEGSNTGSGTTMSQYMEVLKEAGLPSDVPILLESSDGSYVSVNEEVLMNIMNGGMIQVADGSIVGGEGVQFIVQEVQEVNEGQIESAAVSTEQEAITPTTTAVESTSSITEPVTTAPQESGRNVQPKFPVAPTSVSTLKHSTYKPAKGQQNKSNVAKSMPTLEPKETRIITPVIPTLEPKQTGIITPDIPTLEPKETGIVTPGMATLEPKETGIVTPEMATLEPKEIAVITPEKSSVSSFDDESPANPVTKENVSVPESLPMEMNEPIPESELEPLPEPVPEAPTQSDEIITGDNYGEEAMEGFAVMEAKEDTEKIKLDLTQADTSDFVYPEQSSNNEKTEKPLPPNTKSAKETKSDDAPANVSMSVEQALQAMMGEGSDTEMEVCTNTDADGTTKVKPVISHRDTKGRSSTPNEGSIDEETEDLRLVLSPEDDSIKVEDESQSAGEGSLNDSFTLALSSPDSTGNEKSHLETELTEESQQIEIKRTEEVIESSGLKEAITVETGNKYPPEAILTGESNSTAGTSCNEISESVSGEMSNDSSSVDETVKQTSVVTEQSDSDVAEQPVPSLAALDDTAPDQRSETSAVNVEETEDENVADEKSDAKLSTEATISQDQDVEYKESLSECDLEFQPDSTFSNNNTKSLPVSSAHESNDIPENDPENFTVINETTKSTTEGEFTDMGSHSVSELTHKELKEIITESSSSLSGDKNEINEENLTEELKNLNSEADISVETEETGKENDNTQAEIQGKDELEVNNAGINEKDIVGEESAASSPSKDIPYAVGLLPLKTALEKLQAMPEYHPRKTRSASSSKESSEVPGSRLKRKSSSTAEGSEKKLKSEDGDCSPENENNIGLAIEELEESCEENITSESCSIEASGEKMMMESTVTEESMETDEVEKKVEPLPSMMELVSDSSETV